MVTKSRWRERWTPRAIVASLLALGATTASAQRPELCMPEPQNVPGVGNVMPQWPTDTTPAGGWVRTEVSDPRWSSSALVKMDALQDRRFGAPPNFVTFNDQARFRVLQSVDGTQLAVSVQLKSLAATAPLGGTDYVWFGIAREEEQGSQMPAIAVRIPVGAPTTGASVAPATGFIETLLHPAGGAWAQDDSPTWITDLRIWNDRSQSATVTNGAVWTAQFKINLSDTDLNAANRNLRIMTHINADFGTVQYGGSSTAQLMTMQFAVPDPRNCSTDCATINIGSGSLVAPLIGNPKNWHLAFGSPEDECVGISIDRSQISSGHHLAGSDVKRGNCNGHPENCLSAVNTDVNYFNLDPIAPASWSALNAGELTARFRISNWGTVGHPTEWIALPLAAPVLNAAEQTNLRGQCTNSSNQVCAVPLILNPQGGHQCMLAEIEATSSARDFVTIANASEYVNTRFQQASLIDVTAAVDLRDMPDYNPSSTQHVVYLNIVQTNMPVAGDVPYTDNVDAMEATRAQVDREYRETVGGCRVATDYCLPTEGPSFCASLCTGEEFDECPAGREPSYYGDACICEDEEFEGECFFNGQFPPGGGLNPDIRAFDGGQVLESTYPTFMVYPYLATDSIVRKDNGAQRRLIHPLPSFGVHAFHRGAFYGWLTGVTDMAGTSLERVTDNVYRMTVPKNSYRQIRIMLSAEEIAHIEPMSQIAGNATTLGFGLGNVFLTGVSNIASPLNLSTTTMTAKELLKHNTKELVTNFKAPQTLARLPGATEFAAVFSGGSSPNVTVEVVDLQLLGQVIQVQVLGANVSRPSTCGFFGSAQLRSEFRLSDGVNTPVELRGVDQWTCVPTQLLNL